MFTLHRWLCLVVALGLAAAGMGCSSDPGPVADGADMADVAGDDSSRADAEDLTPVDDGTSGDTDAPPSGDAPAVKLTAAELPAGLEGKQKFATEHEGKWVEVTAVVMSLGVRRQGFSGDLKPLAVLCALQDPERGYSATNLATDTMLSCLLPGQAPWKHFNIGSEVTLRGTPHRDGYLDHCTIVAATGEPVPSYTPEEFLAGYKAAPEDFLKQDRCVIVRGKVAGFTGEGDAARAFFKGEGDTTIGLDYSISEFESLKAGDEIAVISCLHVRWGRDQNPPVTLGGCERIDLVAAE